MLGLSVNSIGKPGAVCSPDVRSGPPTGHPLARVLTTLSHFPPAGWTTRRSGSTSPHTIPTPSTAARHPPLSRTDLAPWMSMWPMNLIQWTLTLVSREDPVIRASWRTWCTKIYTQLTTGARLKTQRKKTPLVAVGHVTEGIGTWVGCHVTEGIGT